MYIELRSNEQYGAFPIVPDKDWRKLCARLKGLGINAIFPLVANPAGSIYPSEVVPLKSPGWRQEFPDLLKVILEAAHAEGLEVHPWCIVWHQAPEDFDPNRLVRDAQGKTHNTLCPSHRANRSLMGRMITEVVQRYDVDGIHYDYMRLPGDNYCYCKTCRAGFELSLGKRVADWPADVRPGGPHEAKYVEYLCESLSSFVKIMYGHLKRRKPDLVISAAVWPNRTSSINVGVRQDWGRWGEEGWLDFVAPMNYGSRWIVERFDDFARNEARQVIGKRPFVYGLGALQDTPEGQVNSVRIGRELGCSGFIVYTLTRATFESHLPRLHKEVWASPASVPDFTATIADRTAGPPAENN